MHWYRKAAKQGYADAQYNLGLMYDYGEGVTRGLMPRPCAGTARPQNRDYADAQYNLGLMYANGEGVPEDDAEAVHWYRKAAEQGDANAQNNLGVMYDIWRRCARRMMPRPCAGSARPQNRDKPLRSTILVSCTPMGEGVPEDDIQAYAWISIASAQGVENAKNAKEFLTVKMTRAEIAEAQKLSRKY